VKLGSAFRSEHVDEKKQTRTVILFHLIGEPTETICTKTCVGCCRSRRNHVCKVLN